MSFTIGILKDWCLHYDCRIMSMNKPKKKNSRNRKIIGSPPLVRAVMFVSCWLWQGLHSSFCPADHLLSLQNSYSSCCSHPLPLPLCSFPLSVSHSLFVSGCMKLITCFRDAFLASTIQFLVTNLHFFSPSLFSLSTSHHFLDRDGNSSGRGHSCKCLTLLAGPIVMLRLLLAVFANEDKTWIYEPTVVSWFDLHSFTFCLWGKKYIHPFINEYFPWTLNFIVNVKTLYQCSEQLNGKNVMIMSSHPS